MSRFDSVIHDSINPTTVLYRTSLHSVRFLQNSDRNNSDPSLLFSASIRISLQNRNHPCKRSAARDDFSSALCKRNIKQSENIRVPIYPRQIFPRFFIPIIMPIYILERSPAPRISEKSHVSFPLFSGKFLLRLKRSPIAILTVNFRFFRTFPKFFRILIEIGTT